ncbi:MAG TPA: bifunctional 3'-5' exonuclease/DNA polymerase [Streptosporangiaceae bacterium]|nr:bifunctional 3'-5' exonuclease/DNA polymerase [Streptosporangiaceae bacterium]
MRVAVVPGPGQSGLLCELDEDGSQLADPVEVPDLAATVRSYEASGQPASGQPAQGQPASGQPASGQPASGQPASGQPAQRQPRWVWWSASGLYPALLRAGVRVARCHDVALADALLAARDYVDPGGSGVSLPRASTADPGSSGGSLPGASTADSARIDRARELLRDADARQHLRSDFGAAQQALFDPIEAAAEAGEIQPDPRETLSALIDLHADQLVKIAADPNPGKFAMLVAAESAGALAAAEMTMAGLPWRAEVHDALLTDLLGKRPAASLSGRSSAIQPARPVKLAGLAAEITAAFGSQRPVNPDSPAQILRALAADGVRLDSTRLAVLRDADHPAIPALLEYKELSRLHSAFGWSWLDTWVSDGRFRPEYVVGGVVSGRWASRGGGALQVPRMLRRAVIADPGWTLVVADAAQLEPRVLAALAGDRAFAAAAASGDLYAELAGFFGGERAKAKVALLSAMYGGAGGEAGQLLAVLRQRFPAAAGYVEAAARAGEEGRVVRSVLGRTCPPPSARWRALTEEAADPDGERDPGAGSASRARDRFTRNFVVQASAADWALVMLANLRAGLSKIFSLKESSSPLPRKSPTWPGGTIARLPELVFFQHDEVIVHCPADQADVVVTAVTQAANDATRQVFGPTRVVFPLTTAVVDCYADAK